MSHRHPLANLRSLLLLLIVFCSVKVSFSQQVIKEERKKKKFEPSDAILLVPNYTAQFPFGHMADRFGFNSLFGMQVGYKVKKNWIISVEGAFLFGTKVREAYVLDNISTSTGQFINQNNGLVRVTPQEQGFNVKLTIGKIIPFSEKYPDAGLLLMTGIGFLEHKMVMNVKEKDLPQLSKTLRKGYDRMSNGPVISQFIGGIFLERKKFVSIYGGLQFDIGFTQGRRNFDFYSKSKLNDKRLDMFLGIKIGWVIPIFLQASEKEYFYY